MITAALVRDTFREAFARKIFWGLFGLSTVMILFFLFLLRIDLVEGGVATMSLFGRTADRMADDALLGPDVIARRAVVDAVIRARLFDRHRAVRKTDHD